MQVGFRVEDLELLLGSLNYINEGTKAWVHNG